ncbi:MAG TPA: polymer-forming cytoskeletal protein [Gammaproteobacteria bacterium]|nr:polymer-forming cytoskeletal protein [Gammaproteobacteria bacterium]
MIGKKRRNAKIDSLLGQNTEIQGDVFFSGGLHIDGSIKGNIVATEPGSQITVSDQGAIKGEIRVPNIVLNGQVIGDVYASERIELASEAKVTGTVYYNLIEMAIGAEVNGKLVHHCSDGMEADHQAIESQGKNLEEVD